jgi:acyl-CoA synthetase (AMP-forming)/AMP-acid ligase II
MPTTVAGSVPEALQAIAARPDIADRRALTAPDGSLTYRELGERIARMTRAVIAAGVERGDRIGILADRGLDTAAAFFAVLGAGGVAAILDPRQAPPTIAGQLRTAGISWLLLGDSFAPPADARARSLALADLAEESVARSGFRPDLDPSDDALLLFTSGSSGAPKAVRLSHGNILVNAAGVAERTGLTPEDRLLHVMPLYHTNGINNQLVTPLLVGSSVVMLERFRAETFFDEIARHRPSYVTGVPTIYTRLLAQSPRAEDLRSLRFARCGSAPITEALHRRIEAHLDVPLVVSYGLSEATCTSAMNPPTRRKIGTVGPALSGQEIAVLALGGTVPMAPGAEGEICIRGATLMKGYVGPGEDGRVLDSGWLRTGDLGRLDQDGYLAVTGRLKDVIIRGGENIAPQAIETVLMEQPGIKACCVVGVPNADLGEVPIAFVVCEDKAALDADALKAAVRDRLSRIHAPSRIVPVDALPENAVGKVDRQKMKKMAAVGPASD